MLCRQAFFITKDKMAAEEVVSNLLFKVWIKRETIDIHTTVGDYFFLSVRIARELLRELIMDEHRRYTLLRTNKWLERTALYNTHGGKFVAEKDRLFPIPPVVIDANLTQDMPNNPSYN